MATKNSSVKSTQAFLKMSEVKENTLVLKDGKILAVVAVSSTNFALKSQEEQNGLIFGYQNFLNSLDFEIQILMQSRKMDIHVYLEKLKKIMEQQTNELLRLQTAEYIEFISKLIDSASIMNKNFFVVVPFSSGAAEKSSGSFFSRSSKSDKVGEQIKTFEQSKLKLDQRVNTVIGGLSAMGLKSIQLQTEDIIELMYNSYNFDSGPQVDVSKLDDVKMKE